MDALEQGAHDFMNSSVKIPIRNLNYEDKPEDLINKPNHYHQGGLDVYEIMQAKMSPEEYQGFCKGNVLKYLLREEMKGGIEDLKKMRFNAERLIESKEGVKYIPEHKKELEGKPNG